MKLITAGLTSAVLVAGLVGSVAAYRSQAGPVEPVGSAVPSVTDRGYDEPAWGRPGGDHDAEHGGDRSAWGELDDDDDHDDDRHDEDHEDDD